MNIDLYIRDLVEDVAKEMSGCKDPSLNELRDAAEYIKEYIGEKYE